MKHTSESYRRAPLAVLKQWSHSKTDHCKPSDGCDDTTIGADQRLPRLTSIRDYHGHRGPAQVLQSAISLVSAVIRDWQVALS
jgi:hypothetical protein